MKKIICICFFVLGLVLLQNCDPCGPFEQLDHFDIIGLSNQVLVHSSPPSNTSVYKSNTQIKAEDLHSFQLDWKVNYIAQNIINNSSIFLPFLYISLIFITVSNSSFRFILFIVVVFILSE